MDQLLEKIELRKLAIKCAGYEEDIFNEEDSDFVDMRVIRKKEKARDNCIKKMARVSGAPIDKIQHIVMSNVFETWGQYFERLRAAGVAIATQEEVKEYENRDNKK